MNTRSTLSYSIAIITAFACCSPALAQHTHDHGEHSHGEVAKPKSYADAVRALTESFDSIKAQLALASPALPKVSDEAFRVTAIAKSLGALALAKDSGVARDQVKAVNLSGKDIAAQADVIHDLADAGKLADVRANLPKLEAALGSLVASQSTSAPPSAAVNSAYFCPMHCEGNKTYAAPGVCPICNMKLKLRGAALYTVSVAPTDDPITAGKQTALRFEIKDPKGAIAKDLAIVHEMPLHLLMVSSDLSWYAHEHPTLQSDGSFTMPFTFPAAGVYTLFHDFTPDSTGMQVVPVELTVAGAGSTPQPTPANLKPDIDQPKSIGGYTISLKTPDKIVAGSSQPLTYTISKDNTPVTTIAPYLGAMGHLVIISSDRTQFVHSHPHDDAHDHDHAHDHKHDDAHDHKHDHAPLSADTRGGPSITFDAYFPQPGLYKGWAQFNIAPPSKDTKAAPTLITVPFTFNVQPSPTPAKDSASDNHKHDHEHDHTHP